MKKLIIATAILVACNVHADSSSINTGAAMSLGPSSSSSSLSSASYNPAMNALILSEGDSFRMSYFPTFGFNVEVGELDNFSDDIEELADIIDDPSLTTDEPSAVLDRFNDVIDRAGESGYVKINAGMNAPLLPLYFYSKTLQGTIGFDYSVNVQAGLSFLSSELSYNNQNNSFATASALYLKSGIEQTFAISYGREVFNHHLGKLYAGGKFKYITMELSKQVLPIIELAGEDVSDLIRDEYDQNQDSTSDFGVDIGLVWDAESYRIGLTFENINSPEFEYGEIGTNCESIAENTSSRSNCESARFFTQTVGQISANEVHTKNATARLDGLYKVSNEVEVSSALDLAKYDDIIGDDNQWLHTSVAYHSDGYIIPSIRAGYHKNLAGSKISTITAGVTLFDIVALDFEYGLDSVEIDDSSSPRRLGFSLSIQEQF